MYNVLKLVPGQRYRVIKAFTDYDRRVHPVGETWIFEKTDFLPYDDGLTVYVVQDGEPVVYRLQWREEEQAGVINRFREFVEEE
jgi:Domain of unknown function (DUF3601).